MGAWQAACVLSGPDIDTDAYAHHMIARAILANPRDLAVHWVWLPLFHYLQVPLVSLGGTMNDVRWVNVALAAAVPVLLFRYVRRTARAHAGPAPPLSPDVIALLAAIFAAACPIAMQMATTAQPEPLFEVLILGIAIAFQERRTAWAAPMLAAAVLLRYEAWASLAVITLILAIDPWWRKRGGRTSLPTPLASWVVVALPILAILAWAALRRPVDGRWFGFLGQTHEFAAGATHEQSALDRGVAGLIRDTAYYPITVPVRVFGPVLLLCLLGVGRTVREQGARFVSVIAACLGFVSLTWVMRSSLGLDRHFVVAVPLYATLAAQGVAVIAEGVEARSRRIVRQGTAARTGRAAGAIASGLALASLLVSLDIWMGFWRASILRGWPERAAIGSFLRSIPDAPTVFCDDATIEILSAVDRRRFDRHWVDDDATWDLIERAARSEGVVYVATWNRKLSAHQRSGSIVFRAGQTDADPNGGVAVMRVAPDSNRAAR
jgi:hypothetical protein